VRSGGGELGREFAFGIARQLFEPSLAEASETERADLLQGPAGLAAGLLGLPGGQPQATGERAMGPDASFAVLHGLYWLAANLARPSPACLLCDGQRESTRAALRCLHLPAPQL